MNPQMILCIVVVIAMMVSYTLRKISMELTAMIAMMILLLARCIAPDEVLANFGNENGIMMCAMFIVAAGLKRTQLVNNLAKLLYRVSKGKYQYMLAGYAIVTFIVAQFISSSMVIVSLVLPFVAASCEDNNLSPSKMIFPISLVGVSCITSFPIGSNLTQYGRWNGYLETYGYSEFAFGILDTAKARLPISLVILLVVIFLVPKLTPDKPALAIGNVEVKQQKAQAPLDPVHEVLAYVIFFGTSLTMILQSFTGLDNWVVVSIGAILMVLTGVLSSREAQTSIPISMYLIYVGSLSVGTALTNTGAGDVIGDALVNLIGNTHNNYIIGAVFFLVPFIMTQFMNNRVVVDLMIPICILTCKSLGASPIGPMMLTVTAGLTSYLTPMATPAVSVMMGFGGYDQKQLLKQGLPPALIISVFAIFYVMSVFPAL